jgi:excisionase family DNA binding protein
VQDEISLGDETPETKPNTGVRYERKGPNYGYLRQDVYSVADLALIIGVHTATILDTIKKGKLKALYLGGPAGYRISRDSIMNWINSGQSEGPI